MLSDLLCPHLATLRQYSYRVETQCLTSSLVFYILPFTNFEWSDAMRREMPDARNVTVSYIFEGNGCLVAACRLYGMMIVSKIIDQIIFKISKINLNRTLFSECRCKRNLFRVSLKLDQSPPLLLPPPPLPSQQQQGKLRRMIQTWPPYWNLRSRPSRKK